MASRAAVPQQGKGEEVACLRKPKKTGAEGRPRRALGDIGNLVTLGKPVARVSRPVTRSFCARLHAKAQAPAFKKKTVSADPDGGGTRLTEQRTVKEKVAEPKKGKQISAETEEAVKTGRPVLAMKVEEVPEVRTVKEKDAEPEKEEKISAETEKFGADKDEAAAKEKEAVPPPEQINSETESPVRAKEKETVPKKAIVVPPPGEVKRETTRKKAPSLTSVLSARSKAACGVIGEPQLQTEDIDAGDAINELAAVEYVEDMYRFYKNAERDRKVRDYMESQPEINAKMRSILVDWLVEVHHKFELMEPTLYLAIDIVDRFMSAADVPRRELQLLGIGAMLVASKYEEVWAPEVSDFVYICDKTYRHAQILAMEKSILGKLDWTLTVPTPYVFLLRFIKASLPDQEIEEHMANFLAEMGIVHYATAMHRPSMIAASAVYVSRCALSKSPPWTPTLQRYTGFSEGQLMDCAKLLAEYHSAAAEHKLKAIYRKYSKPEMGGVALLPPARTLLPPAS